jgi:hypothetical protein
MVMMLTRSVVPQHVVYMVMCSSFVRPALISNSFPTLPNVPEDALEGAACPDGATVCALSIVKAHTHTHTHTHTHNTTDHLEIEFSVLFFLDLFRLCCLHRFL